MRARYYSPVIGRFISEDPIGSAGGINLYAYATDTPTGFIDPLGTNPSGGGNNPGILGAATPAFGRAFERMLREQMGFVRNGQLLRSPLGNSFPDFVEDTGFGEAKAGDYIYRTPQLQRMIAGLQEGQSLNLYVAEKTQVSNPLIEAIRETGGGVYRFLEGAWVEVEPLVQELAAPIESGVLP